MNNLMEQTRAAGHSESFSRERNNQVYERLVAGDKAARDEMIQGNMALVILRVDAFLRQASQMRYFRDDLISSGLEGLCEAIDTMQKTERADNANPTGYIYTAIDEHLQRTVDTESTIVVPKMSQHRARQKEQPIERPRTINSDAAQYAFGRLAAPDTTPVVELEEEIRACCRDATDLKIIEMRQQGHTDTEIATSLHLRGHAAISRRRKQIYERFKERCPEYADD